MAPVARKVFKNRTIRVPAELLQRVQVKLAREDRKLTGLVVEQLQVWAADPPGDGLTAGQRLVQGMAELRKAVKFKLPASLDKARLMGDGDD